MKSGACCPSSQSRSYFHDDPGRSKLTIWVQFRIQRRLNNVQRFGCQIREPLEQDSLRLLHQPLEFDPDLRSLQESANSCRMEAASTGGLSLAQPFRQSKQQETLLWGKSVRFHCVTSMFEDDSLLEERVFKGRHLLVPAVCTDGHYIYRAVLTH